MKIKHILTALVAGLLALSLVACGNSASNSDSATAMNTTKAFFSSYGENVNSIRAEAAGTFIPQSSSRYRSTSCHNRSVFNRHSYGRRGFRSRRYHKRGSCNSQYPRFHSGRWHW